MKKPIIYVGVGLIALSLVSMLYFSTNPSGKSPQGFDQPLEPSFQKEGSLSFLKATGRTTIKTIDIEIADDPESIEIGLMYRRNMADTQAMLFIFDREKPQSFWMRNTYISLDLIYIDAAQKIVSIQRNAAPMSDTSLPSKYPAQYVLEVVGGFCDKYGVQEGDFVEFSKTNPV